MRHHAHRFPAKPGKEARSAGRRAIERYQWFMAIPAKLGHIRRALNKNHSGKNYSDCSKGLLAELYACGDINEGIMDRVLFALEIPLEDTVKIHGDYFHFKLREVKS